MSKGWVLIAVAWVVHNKQMFFLLGSVMGTGLMSLYNLWIIPLLIPVNRSIVQIAKPAISCKSFKPKFLYRSPTLIYITYTHKSPVFLPGLNKFNPIFSLFKKDFDGLFKKIRNLCISIGECPGIVHTLWKMHKKSKYLCKPLMN